ncbi:MAG: peroxidase [Dermatophilaceae bacterium]|nr:peroxidase [Dermatophilaceae bacterium]
MKNRHVGMPKDDSLHQRVRAARMTRRGLLAGAAGLGMASARTSPPAAAATRAVGESTGAVTVSRPGAGVGHAVGDPRGIYAVVMPGGGVEARFGRMFKHLPPFEPSDELLQALAARMVESRPPLDDVRFSTDGLDNTDLPAGYTYLGQFVDHDMTRDTTPLSQQRQDPYALINFDTPRFDLGSVYGRGPELDPQLYDGRQPGRLLLDEHDGVVDLPRTGTGTALLGDPRNDENLIICQMQLAFIRLHNGFVDGGHSFADAQRLTRWHYQWLIVHDFLPRIVGQGLVDQILVQTDQGLSVSNVFYKPTNRQQPMMPVEYSAAAYRFGHSMIRAEYEIHERRTLPIFSVDGADLRGSRPLSPDLVLDWNYFFEIPGMDPPDDRNFARLIDTQVARPLATLPPTVITPGPGAITALAARNLLRGKRLGLPAGQDVANAMGLTVLSNVDLGLSEPGWGGKSPLWFYILKESEILGGRRLGPVGARIVTEVILGLLALDRTSYFNARERFSPSAPTFTMGHLLRMANVI